MVDTKMKVMPPSNAQLLATNMASRLAAASIWPLLFKSGRRQTMRPKLAPKIRPMKYTKYVPMLL